MNHTNRYERKVILVKEKTVKTLSRTVLSQPRIVRTKKPGNYFRKFRVERKLLQWLVDRPPPPTFNRKATRKCRYIYYRILPLLFKVMFQPWDRYLCQMVENMYWDHLCLGGLYTYQNLTTFTRLGWYVRYLHETPDETSGKKAQALLSTVALDSRT
jgi:hypothetical protein